MSYKPEATWGWEREQILFNIHQNNTRWTSKLLEEPFSYVFECLLTRKERAIVMLKIDGVCDGEIAIFWGKELSTIKRHVYNIRKKYRLQEPCRVDNHPIVREATYKKSKGKKGFIVRTRRRYRND